MDSDFIFNSDWNYQKIKQDVVETVTAPPTSTTATEFTYPHDLGYIPSARVWYEADTGKWYPLSLVQLADSSAAYLLTITGYFYLTASALVIGIHNSGGSDVAVNLRARIYYDA